MACTGGGLDEIRQSDARREKVNDPDHPRPGCGFVRSGHGSGERPGLCPRSRHGDQQRFVVGLHISPGNTAWTVPSGITTPPQPGSLKDVFIVSHRYGLVTLKEVQMPVLRVTLDLQFELEEI